MNVFDGGLLIQDFNVVKHFILVLRYHVYLFHPWVDAKLKSGLISFGSAV